MTELYIELLKRCVSNTIYNDDTDLMRGTFVEKDGKVLSDEGLKADMQLKYMGGIWPSKAHTMIGIPRLENIQFCVESVLKYGIEGDLIEAGVWRGGASIFMRGILKAHGSDKCVWVADSFDGMPKEEGSEFHRYQDLAVSLEQVKANFNRYGLLDDQVKFLKGWFKDTLPSAPIEKLSVLRLDGDLYDSTMDGLVNLYWKVSEGGFVIVDDYNSVKVCTEAVDDFRKQIGITTAIVPIMGAGGYWRK